jgi:lysine-N-methylase
MRIVDDNFGFNPLLGSRRQQIALRMMNIKQEIPRLIAWYARTK